MTPTHIWAQMSEEYNYFDPETEPACVGIISNIFMKREGVVRSLIQPTVSRFRIDPVDTVFLEAQVLGWRCRGIGNLPGVRLVFKNRV